MLEHLAAYDFGSDDSRSDILGKQVQLEADDAIQDRTCSWQNGSIESLIINFVRSYSCVNSNHPSEMLDPKRQKD